MIDDDFVYNNEEESEMGQLHAIHLNMNAIAEVRRKLGTGPSLEECEECGEEIPKARQLAIQGCRLCVYCQEASERKKVTF
jgi:phage/conjugal plasmid C-4 type zinc finger TraR family protein